MDRIQRANHSAAQPWFFKVRKMLSNSRSPSDSLVVYHCPTELKELPSSTKLPFFPIVIRPSCTYPYRERNWLAETKEYRG
ncbi:hypothetical protein RRG08_007311 [Elysia crispata]|uniref:Uncharacterized protein n=1 Tax=Elysia crispata TaxID=231223 RepID=A0AAE0XVH5_9GAST|nr:hypothetical protein RRG08_007311 [Elysia crispata]